MDKERVCLGETIYRLRTKRGLTQDEAAADLKLSQQTLSNYEKGVSQPRMNELLRIARYFNVSLDDLVFGTNEELQQEIIDYHMDFLEELAKGVSLEELSKRYAFIIGGEALPAENVKRILEQIEFEYYKFRKNNQS